MDREVLLEIYNNRLVLQLILLLGVFFLCLYTTLKLGFQILKVEFKLRKIYPAIIILTLCSCFRSYLPVQTSGILLIFLTFLTIVYFGNVKILKAIWTSILIFLISGVGDIFILSPLSLNKDIAYFLLRTVYGNIVVTIAELIFPLLTLYLLKRFPNLSLIPAFRTKPHRLDILCVAGLCFAFFLVYSNSMRLLEYLRRDSAHVQSQLIYEWLSSLGVVFIIYTTFIFIKSDRKEHTAIQRQNEAQIALLEEQNRKLTKFYEHLSEHLTSNDEELKGMGETISNLQDYNTWLIIQTKQKIRSEDDSIPVAHDLTRREIEFLRLVALDRSNSEIAAELYLSENTVKKYISDLLGKLKLSSRLQLALFALARGFVTEEELKLK